ncbi:hypothetical protein BOTBODRAFT_29251 [Botryobasidium botryosum FD-172 SS1]|uniref:NAD-dependent epimerase/dehydratase domain-containing protein n=1 Tax=Botryobasidium botryosum (strain FD-172 SS1) TaxID=930990 RepID=A0A067N1C6_BOTB1|nr:hypothetical protein BOTBODRAFT_29251 [Botryobasidium botryosum FD-172 SS1]
MTAAHRILVVGGNGFLGSAVCKAAVSKGWSVSSISSSGRPFRTQKGHTPAWAEKVEWHGASALVPETYAALLPHTTAVVHTIGTLLESDYKTSVRKGDIGGLFSALTGFGDSGNPLKQERNKDRSYEVMNRDTALTVLKTYIDSIPSSSTSAPRPFIYISAEDIFRPFVSARYIETKREAELEITRLCEMDDAKRVRGVAMRPGLMYHAHHRPLTTPLAAFLGLSSSLHSSRPPGLNLPTPAAVLRSISPSNSSYSPLVSTGPLHSVANALEIPPIHVDHVAEAVCAAVEREDVSGPMGVIKMREMIGWPVENASGSRQQTGQMGNATGTTV